MNRGRGNLLRPEDFWARVTQQADGCWLWQGWRDRDGYGRLRWHGSRIAAHRLAYQLVQGPIPARLQVCHTCDVPACVNPAHLWIGTNRDNIEDCKRKGRWRTGHADPAAYPRGEAHYHARLTAADVVAIKAAVAAGESRVRVARRYGVVQSHVARIVRGEKWRPI